MSEFSKIYWAKARRWSWIFKFCPYIKEVYIVNSLAKGIAISRSDIDLFIITEKRKVLEVRFYLTVLMDFFGLRVHGNKKSGRFCLSFIVDEDNSDLQKIKYSNDFFLNVFLNDKKLLFKCQSKFYIRNLVLLLPKIFIKWHTLRSIKRAQNGNFKNPSIIISPSIFKFHENDERRD